MHGIFLFGNHHFFIVLMRNAKSMSLVFELSKSFYIGSRRRILFHVSFHPSRILSFSSETETDPFRCIGLETGINAVNRFAIVFRLFAKSIGFGHAICYNGFLECACALLIENFWIILKILSPKFIWWGIWGSVIG